MVSLPLRPRFSSHIKRRQEFKQRTFDLAGWQCQQQAQQTALLCKRGTITRKGKGREIEEEEDGEVSCVRKGKCVGMGSRWWKGKKGG